MRASLFLWRTNNIEEKPIVVRGSPERVKRSLDSFLIMKRVDKNGALDLMKKDLDDLYKNLTKDLG